MTHVALAGLRKLTPHVPLGKSRMETLCLLVLGVISARTVNLTHIAAERPARAKVASTYRRLQRFFQQVTLPEDWCVGIVMALIGNPDRWYLCLDRANWKIGKSNVNVLVLAVVTERYRAPLMWALSRPLVDEFFAWLKAQAARVSRKSDLGEAMAYMLKRQDGFRLFLDDGHVDIDSNLVENAIRSPAMNRRNALFAGHDEGGRNWARFASLIGTCKMINVEPYAYLRDLFISIANGHPAKDIDALMPWAYTQHLIPSK